MKLLGIRKETKNKWEARVPLNPEAVRELVERGVRVKVQPSAIRVYKDEEYVKAGAEICEDLSDCSFILGVKEIPIDDILPGIPQLFFSHVIKGQDYNMHLLQKILDSEATLLDYEKITDVEDRRLVFFGRYAGNAGMVETLWGLGQRLKEKYGVETPFLRMKQAYQYNSVPDAVEHLKSIGKEIKQNGLGKSIHPLVFFVMGYG
ncbi:MAG: hypothetical protein K8S56_06530, partial [Candidatus Cloacimonetes bacterium]|nr:hypothetical protein [Candidatus Cloacimonadota bacterium]